MSAGAPDGDLVFGMDPYLLHAASYALGMYLQEALAYLLILHAYMQASSSLRLAIP